MARTTPSDVNEVFDTSLDNTSLTAWIDIATEIVDDIADADPTIDSSRLTKIEKLVTAHIAASQDQRVDSSSRETASVTYSGDTGFADLRGTKHGQAAIMLDETGTLSTLGRPTASISVPEVKDKRN